jgi:carboxylesterase
MATANLSSKPFSEPEHEAFFWQGGNKAALLIHGFPGTPAEMRALGLLFKDAGWTVHAPLLPGFGPDIESLHLRSFHEWLNAGREAYARLRRDHETILLAGNSMGGAIALVLAAENTPAGLVLIAPFLRFATRWHDLLWPVLRRMTRQIKPFERADFSAPEMRRLLRRMLKDADPQDPEVQRFVRAIAVPIRAIDQVREIGRAALSAAPGVRASTLILQGWRDPVALPKLTRALRRRLRANPVYLELEAGHDLVEPDCAAWPEVTREVLNFAAALKRP